jgi:hypothetical protein
MLSHKGAGAHARNYKAFAGKPVVCHGHRCTRHAQTLGQLSGRGQKVARPKPSVEDRPAQLSIDFSTEIFAVEEVDVELHWLSVYPGTPDNWTGRYR